MLYAHAALVSVLYDSSIQNSFDPLTQHTIGYNHLITYINVFYFSDIVKDTRLVGPLLYEIK